MDRMPTSSEFPKVSVIEALAHCEERLVFRKYKLHDWGSNPHVTGTHY